MATKKTRHSSGPLLDPDTVFPMMDIHAQGQVSQHQECDMNAEEPDKWRQEAGAT